MFKNPFSFEGHIRRTEYGVSFIIYAVIAVIVNLIMSSGSDAAIIGIAYIPMVWFLWSQGAKRCHDLGKNGWWQIIPLYGFWLLFEDGQQGPNQYGDNPKGIQINLYSNNTIATNCSPIVNTTTGYNQGSYNGGHNNQNNLNSSNNLPISGQNNSSDGYTNGDLYK